MVCNRVFDIPWLVSEGSYFVVISEPCFISQKEASCGLDETALARLKSYLKADGEAPHTYYNESVAAIALW